MNPPISPTLQPDRPTILDDPRWRSIVERDKAADGAFGTLWRPPASTVVRRVRHGDAIPKTWRSTTRSPTAQATGFRPCLRCKPDAVGVDSSAALVSAACAFIEASEEPPALALLAAEANLSPSHFHRLFTKTTGLTPRGYASAKRAERVREQLMAGASVTRAIYQAGYNSNSRFYSASGALLGMSPARYRAGGLKESLRFAVGQCSLGSILVASSAKGVAAILLGDDPEHLLRDLQDRFAEAELIGGDKSYERLVATVVGFVERPRLGLNLPLDVRGTAFQQRVWKALQDIPPGRTLSYAEVADAIGSPKAARAVARACAANALAVAIPCHRVIRQSGSVSGYRWGVERKRVLLERESGAA